MCCDGNLFSFVALSGEEAQTLKTAGLEVLDVGGKLRLPQRCGALDGCHCRVYAQRPFVCRRFDCLLARSLTDKELPIDEALGIVAEAKEKLARLEGLLPRARKGEPSGAVRRAAMLHQSGQRVSDAARAAFDEAEEFLRRHFVPD
jgi:Fe-S-cluster containining protein